MEIFLPNKNTSPKKDLTPCVQIELEEAEKRLEEEKRLSRKFKRDKESIRIFFKTLKIPE